MKKEKVYIYPHTTKTTNDYILNFHNSFHENNFVVNNRLPELRLLNIIFNLDSDIFILHWVDVIPYLRFGFFQYYFFKLVVCIISVMNKKIIWVLHNRAPHRYDKRKNVQADNLMFFMSKYSTKVLVHAKEGQDFFKNKFGNSDKVIFIPHPSYKESVISNKAEIVWDFIIWGTINKYKQIVEFLEFVSKTPDFHNKKILICGKCSDESYNIKIKKLLNDNIHYINDFIENEVLSSYLKKSRVILFTYASDTVLSSGAVVYSLNYGKFIIGPNVGNFKDYPTVIHCYNSFSDILKIDAKLNEPDCKEFNSILKDNSWISFPNKLMSLV